MQNSTNKQYHTFGFTPESMDWLGTQDKVKNSQPQADEPMAQKFQVTNKNVTNLGSIIQDLQSTIYNLSQRLMDLWPIRSNPQLGFALPALLFALLVAAAAAVVPISYLVNKANLDIRQEAHFDPVTNSYCDWCAGPEQCGGGGQEVPASLCSNRHCCAGYRTEAPANDDGNTGGVCSYSASTCRSTCRNNKTAVNGGTVSGRKLCGKSDYGVSNCECTCSGRWINGGNTCDGGQANNECEDGKTDTRDGIIYLCDNGTWKAQGSSSSGGSTSPGSGQTGTGGTGTIADGTEVLNIASGTACPTSYWRACGGCLANMCVSSKYTCDDLIFRHCGTKPCYETGTCSTCTQAQVGTFICAGTTKQTCVNVSGAYVYQTTQTNSPECNGTGEGSVGAGGVGGATGTQNTCTTAGTRLCVGTQLQECASNLRWLTLADCASTSQTCSDGACVSPQETASNTNTTSSNSTASKATSPSSTTTYPGTCHYGVTSCSNINRKSLSSDQCTPSCPTSGSASCCGDVITLTANQTCQPGITTRCGPTTATLDICNATGTGYNTVTCNTGRVCQNGACILPASTTTTDSSTTNQTVSCWFYDSINLDRTNCTPIYGTCNSGSTTFASESACYVALNRARAGMAPQNQETADNTSSQDTASSQNQQDDRQQVREGENQVQAPSTSTVSWISSAYNFVTSRLTGDTNVELAEIDEGTPLYAAKTSDLETPDEPAQPITLFGIPLPEAIARPIQTIGSAFSYFTNPENQETIRTNLYVAQVQNLANERAQEELSCGSNLECYADIEEEYDQRIQNLNNNPVFSEMCTRPNRPCDEFYSNTQDLYRESAAISAYIAGAEGARAREIAECNGDEACIQNEENTYNQSIDNYTAKISESYNICTDIGLSCETLVSQTQTSIRDGQPSGQTTLDPNDPAVLLYTELYDIYNVQAATINSQCAGEIDEFTCARNVRNETQQEVAQTMTDSDLCDGTEGADFCIQLSGEARSASTNTTLLISYDNQVTQIEQERYQEINACIGQLDEINCTRQVNNEYNQRIADLTANTSTCQSSEGGEYCQEIAQTARTRTVQTQAIFSQAVEIEIEYQQAIRQCNQLGSGPAYGECMQEANTNRQNRRQNELKTSAGTGPLFCETPPYSGCDDIITQLSDNAAHAVDSYIADRTDAYYDYFGFQNDLRYQYIALSRAYAIECGDGLTDEQYYACEEDKQRQTEEAEAEIARILDSPYCNNPENAQACQEQNESFEDYYYAYDTNADSLTIALTEDNLNISAFLMQDESNYVIVRYGTNDYRILYADGSTESISKEELINRFGTDVYQQVNGGEIIARSWYDDRFRIAADGETNEFYYCYPDPNDRNSPPANICEWITVDIETLPNYLDPTQRAIFEQRLADLPEEGDYSREAMEDELLVEYLYVIAGEDPTLTDDQLDQFYHAMNAPAGNTTTYLISFDEANRTQIDQNMAEIQEYSLLQVSEDFYGSYSANGQLGNYTLDPTLITNTNVNTFMEAQDWAFTNAALDQAGQAFQQGDFATGISGGYLALNTSIPLLNYQDTAYRVGVINDTRETYTQAWGDLFSGNIGQASLRFLSSYAEGVRIIPYAGDFTSSVLTLDFVAENLDQFADAAANPMGLDEIAARSILSVPIAGTAFGTASTTPVYNAPSAYIRYLFTQNQSDLDLAINSFNDVVANPDIAVSNFFSISNQAYSPIALGTSIFSRGLGITLLEEFVIEEQYENLAAAGCADIGQHAGFSQRRIQALSTACSFVGGSLGGDIAQTNSLFDAIETGSHGEIDNQYIDLIATGDDVTINFLQTNQNFVNSPNISSNAQMLAQQNIDFLQAGDTTNLVPIETIITVDTQITQLNEQSIAAANAETQTATQQNGGFLANTQNTLLLAYTTVTTTLNDISTAISTTTTNLASNINSGIGQTVSSITGNSNIPTIGSLIGYNPNNQTADSTTNTAKQNPQTQQGQQQTTQQDDTSDTSNPQDPGTPTEPDGNTEGTAADNNTQQPNTSTQPYTLDAWNRGEYGYDYENFEQFIAAAQNQDPPDPRAEGIIIPIGGGKTSAENISDDTESQAAQNSQGSEFIAPVFESDPEEFSGTQSNSQAFGGFNLLSFISNLFPQKPEQTIEDNPELASSNDQTTEEPADSNPAPLSPNTTPNIFDIAQNILVETGDVIVSLLPDFFTFRNESNTTENTNTLEEAPNQASARVSIYSQIRSLIINWIITPLANLGRTIDTIAVEYVSKPIISLARSTQQITDNIISSIFKFDIDIDNLDTGETPVVVRFNTTDPNTVRQLNSSDFVDGREIDGGDYASVYEVENHPNLVIKRYIYSRENSINEALTLQRYGQIRPDLLPRVVGVTENNELVMERLNGQSLRAIQRSSLDQPIITTEAKNEFLNDLGTLLDAGFPADLVTFRPDGRVLGYNPGNIFIGSDGKIRLLDPLSSSNPNPPAPYEVSTNSDTNKKILDVVNEVLSRYEITENVADADNSLNQQETVEELEVIEDSTPLQVTQEEINPLPDSPQNETQTVSLMESILSNQPLTQEIPEGQTITIGRGNTNNINTGETLYPSVSRTHASITNQSGQLVITDNGSSRGTRIIRNGQTIPVPYDSQMQVPVEVPLQDGDIIELGTEGLGVNFVVTNNSGQHSIKYARRTELSQPSIAEEILTDSNDKDGLTPILPTQEEINPLPDSPQNETPILEQIDPETLAKIESRLNSSLQESTKSPTRGLVAYLEENISTVTESITPEQNQIIDNFINQEIDEIQSSIVKAREDFIDKLVADYGISQQQAEAVVDRFLGQFTPEYKQRLALAIRNSVIQTHSFTKTVAVGDIHGDWDEFYSIISGQKAVVDQITGNRTNSPALVDQNGDWIGPDDIHLVLTGDIVDRAPVGTSSIDTLAKIKRFVESARGRVTLLLGNHDVNLIYAYKLVTFMTSQWGLSNDLASRIVAGSINNVSETYDKILSLNLNSQTKFELLYNYLTAANSTLTGSRDHLSQQQIDLISQQIEAANNRMLAMYTQNFIPDNVNGSYIREENGIYAIHGGVNMSRFTQPIIPGITYQELFQLNQQYNNNDGGNLLVDWLSHQPLMYAQHTNGRVNLFVHSDVDFYTSMGTGVDEVNAKANEILSRYSSPNLANTEYLEEMEKLTIELSKRNNFQTQLNVNDFISSFGLDHKSTTIIHGHSQDTPSNQPNVINIDTGLSEVYGHRGTIAGFNDPHTVISINTNPNVEIPQTLDNLQTLPIYTAETTNTNTSTPQSFLTRIFNQLSTYINSALRTLYYILTGKTNEIQIIQILEQIDPETLSQIESLLDTGLQNSTNRSAQTLSTYIEERIGTKSELNTPEQNQLIDELTDREINGIQRSIEQARKEFVDKLIKDYGISQQQAEAVVERFLGSFTPEYKQKLASAIRNSINQNFAKTAVGLKDSSVLLTVNRDPVVEIPKTRLIFRPGIIIASIVNSIVKLVNSSHIVSQQPVTQPNLAPQTNYKIITSYQASNPGLSIAEILQNNPVHLDLSMIMSIPSSIIVTLTDTNDISIQSSPGTTAKAFVPLRERIASFFARRSPVYTIEITAAHNTVTFKAVIDTTQDSSQMRIVSDTARNQPPKMPTYDEVYANLNNELKKKNSAQISQEEYNRILSEYINLLNNAASGNLLASQTDIVGIKSRVGVQYNEIRDVELFNTRDRVVKLTYDQILPSLRTDYAFYLFLRTKHAQYQFQNILGDPNAIQKLNDQSSRYIEITNDLVNRLASKPIKLTLIDSSISSNDTNILNNPNAGRSIAYYLSDLDVQYTNYDNLPANLNSSETIEALAQISHHETIHKYQDRTKFNQYSPLAAHSYSEITTQALTILSHLVSKGLNPTTPGRAYLFNDIDDSAEFENFVNSIPILNPSAYDTGAKKLLFDLLYMHHNAERLGLTKQQVWDAFMDLTLSNDTAGFTLIYESSLKSNSRSSFTRDYQSFTDYQFYAGAVSQP